MEVLIGEFMGSDSEATYQTVPSYPFTESTVHLGVRCVNASLGNFAQYLKTMTSAIVCLWNHISLHNT